MKPAPRWNWGRLTRQTIAYSRTPDGGSNRCPLCAHEAIVEPYRLPGDAACPNCGQLLWFDLDGTVRDVAGVAARRRMLKAGAIVLAVAFVLLLITFGVPSLNPVELTVIVVLAAFLFGPRLFNLVRRVVRLWPFRRGR
jgi:hypothetical protein